MRSRGWDVLIQVSIFSTLCLGQLYTALVSKDKR